MPLRDKETESRSEVLNLRDREDAKKLRSSSEKSPKL